MDKRILRTSTLCKFLSCALSFNYTVSEDLAPGTLSVLNLMSYKVINFCVIYSSFVSKGTAIFILAVFSTLPSLLTIMSDQVNS